MNPQLLTYFGFVVALLILIWAVLEIRSRLARARRKKMNEGTTWVKFDSISPDTAQEEPLLPEEDEEQEEKPEHNLQTRAQQNGHYSESKKLL